jgi:serine/threonine protein phosphatase 1
MSVWAKIASKIFGAPERGEPISAPIGLPIEDFDLVYAVGDVHGRIDLAANLEAQIADDIGRSDAQNPLVLYLGDIVDRGPKSAHVLDLMATRHPSFTRKCLRGNHEQFMIDFWDDPRNSLDWLEFGGAETLNSYGIYEERKFFEKSSDAQIAALLSASVPAEHLRTLRNLPHFAMRSGYVFCHAGIDPTKPLAEQTAEDFMWARRRFLQHDGGYDAVVVHGHTPVGRAAIEFGRVSVDTGAHETGLLSCAKVIFPSGEVTLLTST